MLRKVKCLHYIQFAEEIFSTRFSERPDYKKLKFLLLKSLLDQNEAPEKNMQWAENVEEEKLEYVIYNDEEIADV